MLPRGTNRAFTLIEMLVSIAVLVLLTALIGQLFSSATMTATMSRNHIDSDEAARQVLDRMGNDLAGMPRRSDINYIFYKNNGAGSTGSSDAMFFYSQAPGYIDPTALGNSASTSGSASPMALVGYRINQNTPFYTGTPVLERLGESLTWAGATDTSGTDNPGAMVYLSSPVSSLFSMHGSWFPTLASNWAYTVGTPPYDGPAQESGGEISPYDTSHYQVIGENVFRMEFCFLLKSGTYSIPGGTVVTGSTGYSNAPTAIPAMVSASGSQGYITSSYFGGASSTGSQADLPGNVYGFPPDLYGIVVTIAVLDNTSRKIVPAGGLSRLAAALNDSLPAAPPNGYSPQPGVTTLGSSGVQANPEPTAQIWQSELEQQGFAEALGIPQPALQRVRVYERTFYLDEN